MKILIPMAGEGSRFSKAGYTFPKPLIDVGGKPMIQRVVENLNFDSHYIFLVRKEHLDKYSGIESTLSLATNKKYSIVEVDSLTEGAASTTLLAKNLIDCDEDLLIANADQLIEFSNDNFSLMKNRINAEGIVLVFNSSHPKWSFVRVESEGYISEVKEKEPISKVATCGVYWYSKGKNYVKYAEQMITKNIRVKNEFYIAPVYNELLLEYPKSLFPFYVQKMWGLGTPEDLNTFLSYGNFSD